MLLDVVLETLEESLGDVTSITGIDFTYMTLRWLNIVLVVCEYMSFAKS